MIVTISRMYGSGGSDVAARVAKSLGWALLDNAVIDAVAERLGVSREEVSEHEERVPSLVERLASTLMMSAPELSMPVDEGAGALMVTAETRIVDVTRRVMEEAVQQGNAVLVGRGAQAMLADRPDALHVFCYAPKPALVNRVVEREGITPDAAARRVEETNKRREQYVRRYWHRSWLALENYHLCVNTDWLGIDGAASLIVRVAEERLR